MSPKCTAAVCASDNTNAAKLIVPSALVRVAAVIVVVLVIGHGETRMLAYAAHDNSQRPTSNAQGDRGREVRGSCWTIMRTLRAPGGCPWDREQTHASLRPFVLEETYEVLEAIEAGNIEDLREELGDYLYEAVFLAQISEEAGDFSIGDAIDAIRTQARPPPSARLREDKPATTSTHERPGDRALGNDEGARARGEGHAAIHHPKTTLSGVPKTLPSLLRAYEISARAAAVGFDWAKAGRCARQDRRGGGRGPARSRIRRDRSSVARRGRDGRSAVRDHEPVAKARHRAGGRAACAPMRSSPGDSTPWNARSRRAGRSLGEATLDADGSGVAEGQGDVLTS